ncbi:MAG: IS1634 family transposase, partial [Chlamydiae bacterium]|nr:IS1634 family transposase [Chlamydiota bacterium]
MLVCMFIRKTHITNRKTKKSYWNFQLVEAVRTERGPRQHILLNLGADLDLDDQERKEVANRIEEILTGQISLVPSSEKVEGYAQKFASQLKNKKLIKTQEESLPSQVQDLHTLDLNTVEQVEPRTVGGEHLLLHIAGELGLPKKLKDLGLSEKQVSIALGSIIGRAVFPASERSTYQWLCARSGLGELLDYDFVSSSLDHLYKTSDMLLKCKDALEKHLEKTETDLYALKRALILYDITNTYMEGRSKGNPKAAHGISKEKRSDCPLVTLGLVIDEFGFASRSSFLSGNIGEPTTLQSAVEQLGLSDDEVKPTVVMDAGIASEENLQWLRDKGYTYIVSARQKAPSMEIVGELVSVEAETSEVKVAFVKNHVEELWLYCESEAKREVSSAMKMRYQERIEADLKKLEEALTKVKKKKLYELVLLRVGRLKEKHKAISGCYEISVVPSEDGKAAIGIVWKIIEPKMEQKLTGHYFLRTNLKGLTPKELWHLYGNLRMVEDAFRFMKSDLGMRP